MKSARHSLVFRTLTAALSIALLVHLAASRDAMSDFTRPVVVAVLHLLGMEAADEGDTIRVGRLAVPWTRDCAGVNLLLVLLALGVWMNRREPMGARYWLRLLALVPAALLANVARVLTLVAYRKAMYPAVENPQLHYFMGLVWLVPFITLLAPRHGRARLHLAMEGLHAAAVVALLAPMSATPNGTLITTATVLALMHCRVRSDYSRLRLWLMPVWVAVGLAVGVCGIESCWLPWLLICPMLLDAAWFAHPAAWCVAASTNSMILMLPGASWISVAALSWMGWEWWRDNGAKETAVVTGSAPRSWLAAACLLCFALPFTASTLLAPAHEKSAPPIEVIVAALGDQGWEVRLPHQPSTIGSVWYGAVSSDRHHTVKVCMKYRGADLESVASEPDVFTDGSQWIREFFLQNHQLHCDYAAYLRSTFRPFAPPGAHVIFVASASSMSAAAFNQESVRLAEDLARHCVQVPAPTIAHQP